MEESDICIIRQRRAGSPGAIGKCTLQSAASPMKCKGSQASEVVPWMLLVQLRLLLSFFNIIIVAAIIFCSRLWDCMNSRKKKTYIIIHYPHPQRDG